MTGDILLDWALMAVSLFNTILLIWLGLTVLLNAEQRSWGIWLASGGLLMGGGFFVSHTAILGLGVYNFGWGIVFWWSLGLAPAIILPFGWYLVMLWYSGYWSDPQSDLRKRHAPWAHLMITATFVGLFALAVGIFLLTTPISNFTELRIFIRYSIAGIPLLALGFAVYVVMCIILSLDALRAPAPSQRMMGTLARQRARPWLVAASLVLFIVSVIVARFVLWAVQDSSQRTFFDIYTSSVMLIAGIDFIISTLISLVIVLLSQAVVSYELFTGKILPRRGLLRHWRRAMLSAAGYGLLIGGTIAIGLWSLYSLLITAILIAIYGAFISWQSYAERERYIDSLRPFVSNQRLYDQLLTQAVPQAIDIVTPFKALCRDVLGASLAYLAPLGPLGPLVGAPLAYGHGNRPLPDLTKLSTRTDWAAFGQSPVPVSPTEYGDAVWALPLWSERGLIGVFLLGEKVGGGLYTQEEVEIARVSGERLIDTQASAEMGRRLMGLQREQLAQSQIIDQRTRRVLHDDILPDLQASLITLSSQNNGTGPNHALDDAIQLITDAHRRISDLLHEMPTTTAPEVARLGLLTALQRTVDDELRYAFNEIHWHIDPLAKTNIKTIPTLTAEVIFYAAREAVRNAAKHGRGNEKERSLCLTLTIQWQDGLCIIVEDNGVGLDHTIPIHELATNHPRSGHGLALHSTMMAVVGGVLSTDSLSDQYTRVTLTLPQDNHLTPSPMSHPEAVATTA